MLSAIKELKPTVGTIYWSYHKGKHVFGKEPVSFKEIYDEIKAHVQSSTIKIDGKVIQTHRKSLVLSDPERRTGYADVPHFQWSSFSTLRYMKQLIETRFGCGPIEYMLVHVYEDGRSQIGWHADREALDTPIISVSLGDCREFRFRPKGDKSKDTVEHFLMNHGDIVCMFPGCQEVIEHCVVKTAKKVGPRINLTCRFYSRSLAPIPPKRKIDADISPSREGKKAKV